jgi:hypothetical protein
MRHFHLAQTVQAVPNELTTYIAFLHDVISAYHQRLSDAASPKVAAQFLASIADKEMRYLGLDKDANPKEKLENMLQNMGMKYQTFRVGEQIVNKLECPFANVVHPRINSTNPICPVSILALGTERVGRKPMVIASNHLTRDGAEYKISPTGPA